MGSYKMCFVFMRKFRVIELDFVDDVRYVFQKYVEGEVYMMLEQFQKFMVDEIGIGGGGGLSFEEVERIVDEVF